MPEETFRQERKPISKSEIQNHEPAANPNVFENVDAVRRAVSNESSNEPYTARPDAAPFAIEGLKNAPAAFLDRLNGNFNNNEEQSQPTNRMQQKRPQQRQQQPQSNLRVTGSNKLEELLAELGPIANTYGEVQLPSLGKFYNGEDGPTDGIIHIRPMTGEEEQILATPVFVKRGQAINMIFNRCMKEKYNSENFLSADRTFLLIWLRGISYGPEYDVEVICPFTDKKFTHTIDLNLEIETCPDNFNYESLTGVLPTTNYNFRYKLSTGADEQRIQDYRDKKSKFDTAGQSDDTLLYRTAMLVEDIEGLTDKHEIQILMKKLPISDVSYLRNLTSEPPFGPDTKITITSPFNMEDFEIDLPLEANFFFPRQRKTLAQA